MEKEVCLFRAPFHADTFQEEATRALTWIFICCELAHFGQVTNFCLTAVA